MEEKKTSWAETLSKVLSEAEKENIALGMDIQKLKQNYYYKEIIAFLKGEKVNCFDFCAVKPLYDKYGYEKVNKHLLSTYEAEQAETQKGADNNE